MSKRKKNKSNRSAKDPAAILAAEAARRARFLAKINGPLITVGSQYNPPYDYDPDVVPWDEGEATRQIA